MPDSSTSAYLTPSSDSPPADLDLDKILQSVIKNLTGLPGDLVRPRWQPTVPKQLEVTVNWIAVGVTSVSSDPNPTIVHDGTGEGSDTLIRHERIEALISCYGPRGQEYASIARDGIYLNQNHSMLAPYGMALAGVGPIRSIPEIISQQTRRRYDFNLSLRRKVTRVYSILNLVSAEIILHVDEPAITEIIEVPDV